MSDCTYVLPRQCGRKCGSPKCKLRSHKVGVGTESQKHYHAFIEFNGGVELNEKNILGCLVEARRQSRETINEAVKYLIDSYQLVGIAKALGIQCTYRYPKDTLITAIVNMGMKLGKIAGAAAQIRAIIRLQQKWRAYLHGDSTIASNNDDPFTLSQIKDMSANDVFAYKDEHGRTWAFQAEDLYYHVRSNSPTNPFTREMIPVKDIRRLSVIMADRPLVKFSLDSCTTVDQMYTYVLGLYDKEGFYLQNEWFKALSIHDLDVVRKVVCRHGNTGSIKSHKDFAHFMLSIVTSTDPLRFPSICLLISTVSRLIPEMEEAVPDWVFASAHAII